MQKRFRARRWRPRRRAGPFAATMYNLPRGYWEAKDTDDDLDAEIRNRTAKAHPLANAGER